MLIQNLGPLGKKNPILDLNTGNKNRIASIQIKYVHLLPAAVLLLAFGVAPADLEPEATAAAAAGVDVAAAPRDVFGVVDEEPNIINHSFHNTCLGIELYKKSYVNALGLCKVKHSNFSWMSDKISNEQIFINYGKLNDP